MNKVLSEIKTHAMSNRFNNKAKNVLTLDCYTQWIAAGGARPKERMSRILVKWYSIFLKTCPITLTGLKYTRLVFTIVLWCITSHSWHFSLTVCLGRSLEIGWVLTMPLTVLCWWEYTIYWPVTKQVSKIHEKIIWYLCVFKPSNALLIIFNKSNQ